MELKLRTAEELREDVKDIKWIADALEVHHKGMGTKEVYDSAAHGPILMFIINRYHSDAIYKNVLIDVLMSLMPMIKCSDVKTTLHGVVDMIETNTPFSNEDCESLANRYKTLCEDVNDELFINMAYGLMKYMSGSIEFEETFFKKLSLISVIRTLAFVKDFKSNEADFCNDIRGYVNNLKGE